MSCPSIVIIGVTNESIPFVMVINTVTQAVMSCKYVHTVKKGVRITSASFGPFDNAFLMVGLSNGIILGLDYPTLEIIIEEQVF